MPKDRVYKALIVDDNDDERALMSRALQQQDFQCDAASDGIMAENMLRTKDYDVVVSDLRMPRKHGHQLIVELLSRKNAPMVVAVTGLAEPKLVVDLLERGVAEVVQKPLSYPVLAAKIKALLKRRKGEQPGEENSAMGRVFDSIQSTTENLRTQLSQVTETFQGTIERLEAQKQQLESGMIDSLRMLSNLISPGGQNRQSHVGRVEFLAEKLGQHVGLHEDQMRALKFAALLHDIGQFGMPDSVRNKPPWALTKEEFAHFRNYPLVGAALLSEVRGAELAADIIEAHCEHFDGTGFPRGLRGMEIPLEARILRLAEGADLIRMYAPQTEVVESLREHLMSERGQIYDPELVGIAMIYLSQAYASPRTEDVLELRVNQLTPGMVLAENLYDEHGHFLARGGAEISELMLTRLRGLLRGQKVPVLRAPPPSPAQ